MSSRLQKKVIMIENPFDQNDVSILDYPIFNESIINNQSNREGTSTIQKAETITINNLQNSVNQTKLHNRSLVSNQSQLIGSLYEKNKQRKIIHDAKLEEQRSLQRFNEMQEQQSHPKMNDISRQIVQKKNSQDGVKSINSYFYKNKITKANTMNLKNILNKESTIEQEITQKVFNQKSFDLFLKKSELFIEKKKKKDQITIEEGIIIHSPVINKRSKAIVELSRKTRKAQTTSHSPNHSFIETPVVRSKVKRVLQKYNETQNYTFTPKLIKKPIAKHSLSPLLYPSNKTASTIPQSSTKASAIKQSGYNSNFINEESNIFKKRLLKMHNVNMKANNPIANNSTSMLYKLNISNNTSTHDAYSVVSLHHKHQGILDLHFA